ncbi:UNVERIFIED_ORG: 3-hydroxyacyl-CoA dehydrogenase [Xanthobacter viscosus]|jgi:3-hydroxyacyl-CoA dehydrogenase|uniref:3-hydroxyacyl-CoA dehydrogenase n=1 Tax=Xanthobacter autotrophicus TaxID=280 RepID=A0A6C1KR02_XANAU|nr:3-hydroxyacyl-CoA dehydrogenase [Xanthobacter autotrophicus]TLX40783.1 3-hydroxyacyl-CoA dehydrogenase [Xanthobacter autotrophicus]
MTKIAIIGSGFIGRAWAITFARAGFDVALADHAQGAPEAALAYIEGVLPDLADNDLLNGASPEAVRARLSATTSYAQALDGAAHAQENAPEDLAVKKYLYEELDSLAGPDTVLASSTSALLPSLFSKHLKGRERVCVCHPINPPYLIPAVEVVPAPWTSADTMTRAADLMRAAGQSPIVMKKELDGFVMNRMQGALLEEAFRLVADGYASVEDVDIGIREGLALRWSFMGPFETIDLNAPGGVADYVARYQQIYERISPDQWRRVDWAGPVLETVLAERRARLPEDGLAERQVWRDRRLMALAAHKRKAAKDIGA